MQNTIFKNHMSQITSICWKKKKNIENIWILCIDVLENHFIHLFLLSVKQPQAVILVKRLEPSQVYLNMQ